MGVTLFVLSQKGIKGTISASNNHSARRDWGELGKVIIILIETILTAKGAFVTSL